MEPNRGNELPFEQVGPYRLEELLGQGGMGAVWRAWDERLKRQVAAKRVRADAALPHARARLRREAQAVARLNHPSIVQIYDIVEWEDVDWIIMELVSGQTLRQCLHEKGPFGPARATRLGCEIAEGLAEAHEASLLHRDLKAANVMVTPAGRAKILDFGLAKEIAREEADQDQTLSVSGAVLGTAYAMSPEQLLGPPFDARSDLFSFGALLYEVLTGNPPFRGNSPIASMARVLEYQPPPLQYLVPGISREISDFISALLEKNPADRPQSAREVARVLAALAAREGESLTEGTAIPRSLAEPSPLLLLNHRPSEIATTLQSSTLNLPQTDPGAPQVLLTSHRQQKSLSLSGRSVRWLRWRDAVAVILAMALVSTLILVSARENSFQIRPERPLAVHLAALQGEILDAQTREPLVGVQVQLPEYDLEATTGVTGKYRFDVPEENATRIKLRATKKGYRTLNLDLPPGDHLNVHQMWRNR